MKHAPHRVLVVTQDDTAVADAVKAHGGKSRRLTPHAHAIDLPPTADETAVLARLKNDRRFVAVELDQQVKPALIPNDSYYPYEWHAPKIGLPAAWDVAQGAGVVIAILDTGIEPTHPDLAQQLVPGWNVLDANSDTHDVNGHGTTVAGAAAAMGGNGWGVCGVAPKAKLMPVRIADPSAYAYWSDVASGLTWAADHGARVANISYDGVSASATMQSAASYFRSKGGVVVVAAGNDSTDPGTAPTDTMLVVSATDQNDAPTSWTNRGAYVDLAAPGIDIYSTGPSGQVWKCWGTSLASPIIAGVVALMMSANPALPPSQIEALLLASVTDLGAAGKDAIYGAGRVNAAAAAIAARDAVAVVTPPPAPAPAPAPSPAPKPGNGKGRKK